MIQPIGGKEQRERGAVEGPTLGADEPAGEREAEQQPHRTAAGLGGGGDRHPTRSEPACQLAGLRRRARSVHPLEHQKAAARPVAPQKSSAGSGSLRLQVAEPPQPGAVFAQHAEAAQGLACGEAENRHAQERRRPEEQRVSLAVVGELHPDADEEHEDQATGPGPCQVIDAVPIPAAPGEASPARPPTRTWSLRGSCGAL